MSVAPAPAAINKNIQVVMPKNMVLDPKWFDGNQTKFKDWWRGIWLFLKSNRIMETNDRITAILAHLRGGVVGIYIQKKLDELDEELSTQDWKDFICHMKVHPSGNYIPTVISSLNYTSLPSMVVIFLTTYLMAVLQPSGYFIFHSRDTPIQLSLL